MGCEGACSSNLTNIQMNLLYISYIRDEMSEKSDERAEYCDERQSNTIH